VKDTGRKSKTGEKSKVNYNKTETILLYNVISKKYITVPISAILKFNNSWIKH
jgi:hypothetical protein